MKDSVKVFGLGVSNRNMMESVAWIKDKINRNKGAVVYCCTLNEARMNEEDANIRRIFEGADLVTADGMPLVWALRLKSGKGERVYGPDLMRELFYSDKKKSLRHFFLGSSNDNLKKIQENLVKKYGYKEGNLGVYSPEFKEKFEEKDFKKFKSIITNFKADIVWVGMGAEKQVVVANKLKNICKGVVFITVGAAFDFLSGSKKQAPIWLRKIGGEWFFRLIMEPRRLMERYLKIILFLAKRLIS